MKLIELIWHCNDTKYNNKSMITYCYEFSHIDHSNSVMNLDACCLLWMEMWNDVGGVDWGSGVKEWGMTEEEVRVMEEWTMDRQLKVERWRLKKERGGRVERIKPFWG